MNTFGWGSGPQYAVLCEDREDRYIVGPFDSWDAAEVAQAQERDVQYDHGEIGYANRIVPVRNGEGQ